jgi:hypothetical protein
MPTTDHVHHHVSCVQYPIVKGLRGVVQSLEKGSMGEVEWEDHIVRDVGMRLDGLLGGGRVLSRSLVICIYRSIQYACSPIFISSVV